VIDKVDVRISEFALPGPVLAEPICQLKKGHPTALFRGTKYYHYSADLRGDFGIDAIVHLNLRFGRPTHKVEIIDAGQKSLQEMAEILVCLFDVDPWSLQLMRVDLAADIEGVPVSWFQANAYVSRKQFSSRIEKSHDEEVQFVKMANAQAETIYAGKRPKLMRIYNKTSELKLQHRREEMACERFNRRMEKMGMTQEQNFYGARYVLPFAEFCKQQGHDYRPGSIVTRIENQIGGRLPAGLQTFSDLRFAHDYQPFQCLTLAKTEGVINWDAPPPGVSTRNWMAALGLRALVQAHGSLQSARSIIYKHSNGNGKRVLETLEESMPGALPSITIDQIQESYRQSTMAQTAPIQEKGIYLCPTYEKSEPVTQGSARFFSEEGAQGRQATRDESDSGRTE
jgi:hypothetical protein